MTEPPNTYPNPRSDDAWDNDAVHWLLDQPGVGAEWTRGTLMEAARRQPKWTEQRPERVAAAEEVCRRYGVVQREVHDDRLGKTIVRLIRTDHEAPEYPPDRQA